MTSVSQSRHHSNGRRIMRANIGGRIVLLPDAKPEPERPRALTLTARPQRTRMMQVRRRYETDSMHEALPGRRAGGGVLMPVKLISSGIAGPCDSGCNPGAAAPVSDRSSCRVRCRDKMCRAPAWDRTPGISVGGRALHRPHPERGPGPLKAGVRHLGPKTSTGAWHPLPIVTVRGVDLDSGIIGDVRYPSGPCPAAGCAADHGPRITERTQKLPPRTALSVPAVR